MIELPERQVSQDFSATVHTESWILIGWHKTFLWYRQNPGFWLVGTKHFWGTYRILDSDWLAQNISTKMKCRLRCSYRALFNRQVSIDFRPPSISSIEPTSAVIIQFSYFLKLNYFDSPRYLGFEDQKFWHAEYLSVNVKFITTVGISF